MRKPRKVPCPACPQLKLRHQYVCGTCWRILPDRVRAQLSRRDARAFRRVADLYEQIRQGTPLAEIEIADE